VKDEPTRDEIVDTVREKKQKGVAISEMPKVDVSQGGLGDKVWWCFTVFGYAWNEEPGCCARQVVEKAREEGPVELE